MKMKKEWRLTVVGGSCNGCEYEFAPDKTVVVGRSHTADVKLSKLDADVSGRHAEFSVVCDIAQVKNLSQTRPLCVNGQALPIGASCAVQAGDSVELGVRVRIRLDCVPEFIGFQSDKDAVSVTGATKFFTGDLVLDEPTAVMDDSKIGDGAGLRMTMAAAGCTTATRMPVSAEVNVSAQEEPTIATRVPVSPGLNFPFQEGATSATRMPESALTGDSVTETGDGVSEDGQTVEGKTRAGSWEEIQEMKNALDHRRKMRRFAVVSAFAVVAVALTAVYFLTGGMDVEPGMDWPKNPDGTDDVRTYAIRNSDGYILLKVDYPGNPNIAETPSPDNNGISVVSWYGKKRDVPYFLQFETISHPDELNLDLMASAARWFAKAEMSGEGYIFDERMRAELKPRFFEDAYPGSCQIQTLYGVRFLEFEYKRTWPDGKLWHGWAHYFRSGDTVYLLRREIPEFYWERGGYRIKKDPNIAVYGVFSEGYWESSGVDKSLETQSADALMRDVRGMLARERVSDWSFVRRSIDAVLARTWRTDLKTRELAESCLRQYRDVLRVYYNGKYNAFLSAKDNREEKKMRRIRKDVQIVFNDPEERYYFLVNSGEVW